MKKIINYIIMLLIGCFCMACSKEPLKNDKEVVMLIDESDPLRLKPDADEISSQLGLKQDIWQGIKVLITYISDKDINTEKVISLEKAAMLSGNKQLRTLQVEHFKKELRAALSGAHTSGSLNNSIIYRTVARHLNELSASTAKSKYLMLYSDLMENDEISFYNPATLSLLRTHPDVIRQRLERTIKLRNLTGIQVWLLYEPKSFNENNTYMAAANLYKQMLEAKGATVHIANTLNL